MDISEALQIVRFLADGVDPITGEVFPDGSPYQHHRVVRSLSVAVAALERAVERKQRENHLPEKAGKPWSRDEDKLLVEQFDAAMSTKDLANRHNRTEGAIQSRLAKLGKIVLPAARLR